MFERFTERARQVVVLAQQEARNNKCTYAGTEHILMGLLREEEGLAARILASLDVELEKAAEIVGSLSEGEPREVGVQVPFTPRAKKVLELALREALGLGHNYISTEHVLLGLLRDGDNKAVNVLSEIMDIDNLVAVQEKIRNEVIRMLSGPKAPILQKGHREGVQAEATRIEKERLDKLIGTLDELKKTKALSDLIETAVLLGRQFPDKSAYAIAQATMMLHD
jgi:ATP-dependent Clp protease ATP-binding subunit ClpC